MRTKATFLAGFATGYVLGARAGRARYEQIRQAYRSFMSNPTVQSTASQLQHQAGDVLSSAKDLAADKIGERMPDKRPTWLGHGSKEESIDLTGSQTGYGSGMSSTVGSPGGSGTGMSTDDAGSNGRVGM
jgi:hypothetical protein